MKIYHNPRCKKSRAGLQYLKDKGIEPEIIEYLKEMPGVAEISALIEKTGKPPMDLIRKQEEFYKKNMKGKNFSDAEILQLIVQNPKLLARPIITDGKKAVLGDPPENIEEIL